ncbi:MAG: DUF1858 domain-containing protein [Spirochaetes bacterium]|nr:DUF1858 domain-containing protein [Spirochaetota bacterium]
MITKDMSITDAINKYPETIPVLQSYGLGCLGCIAASGENLEDGLKAHGLDVDEVIKAMNKVIKNK